MTLNKYDISLWNLVNALTTPLQNVILPAQPTQSHLPGVRRRVGVLLGHQAADPL